MHGCTILQFSSQSHIPNRVSIHQTVSEVYSCQPPCNIFCWNLYLDHNKYSVYHLQVVLLVLGSFSVCWLPYMIVTCTILSGVCTSDIVLGYKATFSLAMVNSCVNPIIYAWKNPEFHQAIKRLLHCSSPNRVPPTPSFITENKISFRTTGTNVDSSEHQTTADE
jgi:hypothetical protein